MNISRKLLFGLIFGLVGGLFFSICAWGVNAFLLAQAHFAYPWLPLILGVFPSLLLGGLAGYLTIRLDHALLGALCWLITGLLMSIIGVFLPLKWVPELLPHLEPILKDWIAFNWMDAYTFLLYSAMLITGIAFVIIGLVEGVLIEQASYSPYGGAILMPALICTIITGVTGGVIDNLVNVRFRNSALGLNQLISFAIQNQGRTIDPVLSRQMHMGALSSIKPILSSERRMFYFHFNETADQGLILVDFKGQWALCDMFQDQPAFCRLAEPPG